MAVILKFSLSAWPEIQDRIIRAGYVCVPCGGKIIERDSESRWIVSFPTDEDATMFKLTWTN